MIVQFIHLILLCYGCSEFAGYYAKMPNTAFALWLTFSFLIIYYWLPSHTEKQTKNDIIPSFIKTYNIYTIFIVAWICLFFVFVNPLSALKDTFLAKSETLTIVIAMFLYLILLKPFMSSLYEMLKPVLAEKETLEDFLRARQTVPIIFFPPVIIWLVLEDMGLSEGMGLMSEIKTLTIAPVFLFGLYLLSPRLFNWAWKTENADSELVHRLKELSKKAETQIAGVKIWNTFNEPLPNAAVAGLISKFRFVYITDYLLKSFTDKQAEAVVGHELGHLRLGHVTSYLLFSINAIIIAILLKSTLIIYFPFFYVHDNLSYVLEIAIFIPIFAVTFTALARRCEKQADIFSSIITEKESFISSMQIIKLMLGTKPKWFPNWLLTHPEADERIENIRKTDISHINILIKSSNIQKYTLLGLLLALIIALINPLSIVYEFSKIYNASHTGNYELVENLRYSLPERLQNHPFVFEQKTIAAFYSGNYALAIVDSFKAYLRIDFKPEFLNYYQDSNPIKKLFSHFIPKK